MNKIKYSIPAILLSISVPIIFQFWAESCLYAKVVPKNWERIMNEQLNFTQFYLPIYLITINYLLAKWFKVLKVKFKFYSFLILSTILLSAAIDNRFWQFFRKDYDIDGSDISMLLFEAGMGIMVCILPLIIIYMLANKKNDSSINPRL
jgi:hypothetical protein